MYDITGLKVKEVRYMTPSELEREWWNEREKVVCIIFEDDDDDIMVFPSADDERNYPGVLLTHHGRHGGGYLR